MAVDPLSPIAPARIRALLLPVGRIKRSRFLSFVDLIQPECIVRLGDISPDPRPDRNMFSPLAFPAGKLLYEFSTSFPPPSQLSLSPFEQFREPFMVIGLADAMEYSWLIGSSRDENGERSDDDRLSNQQDDEVNEIKSVIQDLREQFPKVYLHSLMIFDCAAQSRHPALSEGTIFVPPSSQLKTTTMKTIICDLTSKLLAEMTTLARSIQALPTVKSPGTPQGAASDDSSTWTNSDSQLGRRNSQLPSSIRPESPAINAQKDHYRMSMPAQLPSSSSNGPIAPEDPRASSPTSQGVRTPPTTFDEISGVNAGNFLGRTNSASKPNTATIKDPSADRVSIHGFGSGGVGERARNKGRGRVQIVIGTLYLSAGHWQYALGELVEGATRARAFSDHLWHAKALENILICLLLLAWSGMDFQVPQICYPIAEKSSTKSPQHTPSNSMADVTTTAAPPKPSNHELALDSLNSLLPDLVTMTLNIYNRASNFAGEAQPPLATSESVIRFCKLLTVMNLSVGSLDDDALQHIVTGQPLRQRPRLSIPRLSVTPARSDIASTLFRALPSQSETASLTAHDRVTILAGMASVLSALGLQRKKAIIMKEFVTSLIPGLVQARKIGAAEMGVHPAAGLTALNMASGSTAGAGALNLGEGEIESGIDDFLGLLGRIYGVPDSRASLSSSGPRLSNGVREHEAVNGVQESVVEEILKLSALKNFGSLALKLDILRICINFCEALPDFNGVLHFTATLLRIAGPGTAPKSNSTDVFVSLGRDEQARLAANISKTIGAAQKLGLQHIETEYWDDFLVRGLSFLEEPIPLRLTHHRPAELKTVVSSQQGPFLHNPFLKQPDINSTERILVANEEYRIIVSLQNPYDFEVDIESLRIAGEGVEFYAHEDQFLLGPFRTQKFPVYGMARSSGSLTIGGCYVKVRGCRERLFPVFVDSWKPEKSFKMKKTGLKVCSDIPTSRPPTSEAAQSQPSGLAPTATSLSLTVIPEQPVVVVSEVSLPQSSLMVLEGEKKTFSITLHNTSKSTLVDFLHISFKDSATSIMQAAISNRDLPAAELHELEVQLAQYPSIRWCKSEEKDYVIIKPDQKATFEIEVSGRARLTDATIQFDYAYLGKRRSEVTERFFTRQLSVPIAITVNASVQLQRPEIVPLSGDFAWSTHQGRSRAASTAGQQAVSLTPSSLLIDKNDTQFNIFLRNNRLQGDGDEYCMLLLDLRNSWPNPLSISLQVRAVPTLDDHSEDSWNKAYTVNEVIQPGHVNRIVVVLPKIYIKDPYAPIPSLNPANQRQFVVSTSRLSPEAERASREAFWYREELLKRVRGTWCDEGSGRHGDLELRSIRFTSRMVEAMKLDDVLIETDIRPDYPVESEGVQQLGRSRFEVKVNDFLMLKTKVHNRSQTPISPLLRLQPYMAGLPHAIALDLDKRFSWSGVLQRKLPLIQPGQSVESELGIVALCSGIFEIGVTVEEIELLRKTKEDGRKNRDRSGSYLMQANVLGEPTLKAWQLKEPCKIIAKRI